MKRPPIVLRIALSFLTTGLLGLIAILSGPIPALLSAYDGVSATPELWLWRVEREALLNVFLQVLIGFCVLWSGWVFSGLAIFFGRWWGWVWALALCLSVFAIGIDLALFYSSAPLQNALGITAVFALCAYGLFQRSIIGFCGVTGVGALRLKIFITLNVVAYLVLYEILKVLLETVI